MREAKNNIQRPMKWFSQRGHSQECKAAAVYAWVNGLQEPGVGLLRAMDPDELNAKIAEWKEAQSVVKEARRVKKLEEKDLLKNEETVVERFAGREDGLLERVTTQKHEHDKGTIKTVEEAVTTAPAPVA